MDCNGLDSVQIIHVELHIKSKNSVYFLNRFVCVDIIRVFKQVTFMKRVVQTNSKDGVNLVG